MPNYYYKKKCRLCKSDKLLNVMKYNKSPICDEYLTKLKKQKFYNLNLMMCSNCNFVQIDTVIDPSIIYKNYIYKTLSSITLKKHFKNYSEDVASFYNKNNKTKINEINSKLVIDIGSNDGTLLKYFKNKKYKVLGIDPAKLISKNANKNGIETICNFFSSDLSKKIFKKYQKADIILINNLFANIDELHDFCSGIKYLLDKNGLLIIESSYLIDMIQKKIFDFVYHEHLSYLSIVPLRNFFMNFDIKLIKVQHVDTKGGSLRYYFANINSNYANHTKLNFFVNKENKFNVSKITFSKYETQILKIKKDLNSFLKKNKNAKIFGYGASATTTTLISYFEIHKYFNVLIDDNLGKIGTLNTKKKIAVHDTKKILKDKPDIIVILAWRYHKNIIKKIRLMKIGNVKIILPLPKFQIINL